jgi:hypothetical protein
MVVFVWVGNWDGLSGNRLVLRSLDLDEWDLGCGLECGENHDVASLDECGSGGVRCRYCSRMVDVVVEFERTWFRAGFMVRCSEEGSHGKGYERWLVFSISGLGGSKHVGEA